VCTQSTRSASTGSISTRKAQEEQRKIFFAKSAKRLPQGVHSRLQEFKILHKIACKECTIPEFDSESKRLHKKSNDENRGAPGRHKGLFLRTL
jgi:hypothetical protein